MRISSEVIRAIREAKDHIPIEYYIYELNEIGAGDLKKLIQKQRKALLLGIYDDLGAGLFGEKWRATTKSPV